MPRNTATYDGLLLLKEMGNVTASGAATVQGAPRVLDLGPANAGPARAVINCSDLVTSASETYRIDIQGSNDITFATGVVTLGSVTVTAAQMRHEAAFRNAQGETTYRYVRAYHFLVGAAASINYVASIARS